MRLFERFKIAKISRKKERRSLGGAFKRSRRYISEREIFQRSVDMEKLSDQWPMGEAYPMLFDFDSASGSANGHYFHQDLFVAREIFKASPVLHLDVGSRIDGFIAHLCVFRSVDVADIRALVSKVSNLNYVQVNMMEDVPDSMVGKYDSVSCLHALEHFGLGRYGDPLDAAGHLKGLYQLQKTLKNGGRLYLSVPIGNQRIEFNAHRVFAIKSVMEMVDKYFLLENFHYVDDAGDLHENMSVSSVQAGENYGCQYGCGIFVLQKNVE